MVKLGDLIGKKFVNGGRDVQTGMDCWGLVMEVYRRYGITIPDFTVDAFAFHAIDLLAGEAMVERVWEEVCHPYSREAPLVVLMRMHPELITHAGVFVGNKRIIHTMKGTGVIMSHTAPLQSRIAGYYRYVQNN